MIISFLLTAVCAVIAFYGFDAFYNDNYLLGIVAHFCGSVIGVVIVKYRMPNQRGMVLPLVFNFCVPIIGALGVALLAMATRDKGRKGILEEYSLHINPEEYRELFTRDYNDFQPDPEKLYSLSDILHSDLSVVQKRVAIEALAQMESPHTVAILREALQMGSVEVRFFSASVLGKMEMHLEEKFMDLKSEDRGACHVSVILDLAQTCFDFVFFTLVDGVRKEEYLNQALGYALDALSLEMNNNTLILVGRILIMKKKYREAVEIFNLYIKEYPDDIRGWLWGAEAYLHNKDYVMACESAKVAMKLGRVPAPLEEAVRFWAMGVNDERAI